MKATNRNEWKWHFHGFLTKIGLAGFWRLFRMMSAWRGVLSCSRVMWRWRGDDMAMMSWMRWRWRRRGGSGGGKQFWARTTYRPGWYWWGGQRALREGTMHPLVWLEDHRSLGGKHWQWQGSRYGSGPLDGWTQIQRLSVNGIGRGLMMRGPTIKSNVFQWFRGTVLLVCSKGKISKYSKNCT